ncbi:TPA: hypothetical protein ACH3X2_004389 [Trebouxia sp. C0005]
MDFLCSHLHATGLLGVKQVFRGLAPEGIAKLVYVLLYNSLAQGALAMKCGWHMTIRCRRQLATASSKEELAAWAPKYGEPFHLSQLHDDAVEDRQACGTLAQLACDMRLHTAWKANFDALQFANPKLDSNVLSNMGSYLKKMAAEQLLAEEAADQVCAEAKKAKKQRQKAKKQQAQTEEPQPQHAQQEQPQAQHAQHEEQQAQHAQHEDPQAQHAQHEDPQAQHAQHEDPQAQHAQHEELTVRLEAKHAYRRAQQNEHEQNLLALKGAG